MSDKSQIIKMKLMFSKMAAESRGANIAIDNDGNLHEYTAAIKMFSLALRTQFTDEVEVVEVNCDESEGLRNVQLHGHPWNKDKWKEWGYDPTRT